MKSDRPPVDLVRAFKSAARVTDISVLMVDDGFDPILIRVLNAWEKAEHAWKRPRTPPPPNIASQEAWKWLTSGWAHDYYAVSVGANITRDQARELVNVLVQARLIYPDGSISEHARKAMTALIASRLRDAGGKRKKSPDDEGSDKVN